MVSVPLPTPHTIERDGTTYAVNAFAPRGIMVDPADPRALTVIVDDVYAKQLSPRCNTLQPTAVIAQQDGPKVEIATFAYRYPTATASAGSYTCTYVDSALYSAVRLRLTQPVGDRPLYDVKTGKEIGILDPRNYPRPDYVPAGFVESAKVSLFSESNPVALRQYRSGKSTSLELRISSQTAWAQLGTVTSSVSIDGQRGQLTNESFEHCLSWAEHGLVQEVCSIGRRDAYLPDSELIKIAESWH